jgi:uncharacterized membrane protein YoaK (UPF0700 family)
MLMRFLRHLSGSERSPLGNRRLGAVLAFVAGGINAGGFLAVNRYTSHMTGLVSSIADHMVLGEFALAYGAVATITAFVLGAATTAVLINWARRRRLRSEYALPLLLESMLLLLFGVLGSQLSARAVPLVPLVALTVVLLCFVMGLQNAVVTKISQAEIRTTHLTGVLTDLGIELGRALYWNRRHEANAFHYVRANRAKMQAHALIFGMFLAGAFVGALAFRSLGFAAALPYSALLLGIALAPVVDDLKRLSSGPIPERPPPA